MQKDKATVTVLLQEISEGNTSKINKLIPLIYSELHQMASHKLYGERAGHTINPTALAHEAYIKLINQENTNFQNRSHFFALAAQTMRRILIDYARSKNAQKRGGENQVITFIDEDVMNDVPSEDLLALDEALTALNKINERQSQVIEYWFFGGLKHKEIAQVLNISLPSVRRDWRFARAWLSRRLKQNDVVFA